jgi:hypothetical protein
MTNIECESAKPYREYAKGTPIGIIAETQFAHKISLEMPICCHENAPFVMFRGKPDNFRCESARKAGLCPMGRT